MPVVSDTELPLVAPQRNSNVHNEMLCPLCSNLTGLVRRQQQQQCLTLTLSEETQQQPQCDTRLSCQSACAVAI